MLLWVPFNTFVQARTCAGCGGKEPASGDAAQLDTGGAWQYVASDGQTLRATGNRRRSHRLGVPSLGRRRKARLAPKQVGGLLERLSKLAAGNQRSLGRVYALASSSPDCDGFILIYLRSGHAPKVPSGDSAPASKPTGEAFAASANDLRAPDVRPLARLAREGEDLAAELRGTGVALFQRKKEVRQRILTWRNELAACLPNVKWLPIAPVPDSLVDCGPYVAERRDVLSAALKANQSEPRQVPFPVTGKPRFRLGPPHAVKEFHSNLRTREIGAGNVTFGQVEISNSGEQANAVQVRLTYRRANGTTITSVFGTWAEPGDPFRVESRVNFNPDDVHLLNVALRVSGEISAVDAQVLRDKRLWLPDHILDGTPYTVDIELLGQKLRVGVQPVGQDDIAVQPLSSD
jgi:hypothetical protein